jgi:intein-encoded DNA endonuclease-like protein
MAPELVRHYIRGYFDGDGSVYFDKRVFPKLSSLGASVVSGSDHMLEFIKNQVEALGIKVGITPHSKTTKRIRLNSTSAKIFMDWIYKDAAIYLERKKERLTLISK